MYAEQVAAQIEEILDSNEPCRLLAAHELRKVLVRFLSPQEQETLLYVSKNTWCTMDEFCAEFGLKPNHAGKLLKRLVDLGLLERREGPPFEYRAAPDPTG